MKDKAEAVMQDAEANQIVRGMLNAAVVEMGNIAERISRLSMEYEQDPWEETAAQIKRLEERYARRVREAQALTVVVRKFEVRA